MSAWSQRVDQLFADEKELASIPEGVTLERDGRGWFCYCTFLDYFAGGDTPADAVRRFWLGLMATIALNLRNSGDFKPVPRARYDEELALGRAAA